MIRWLFVICTVSAWVLSGCGDDAISAGYRSDCARAGGTLLGCDSPAVDNAEDACSKLVECGVIPVESMDSFDWRRCVARIEDVASSERRAGMLACFATSSCDQLKEDGRSLCFQYGEQ